MAVFTAAETAPKMANKIPAQRHTTVPSQNPYFMNSGSYFRRWITVNKRIFNIVFDGYNYF